MCFGLKMSKIGSIQLLMRFKSSSKNLDLNSRMTLLQVDQTSQITTSMI